MRVCYDCGDGVTVSSPTSARRSYVISLVAGVIGGGMVAVAAAKPWATTTVGARGLPALPVSVDGADVVPVVAALGLVLLAGAVSLAATKNQGRRLAGLVLVGAAVVVGWLTLTAGPAITDALREQTVGSTGHATPFHPDGTPWRWLTLAGAGLSLLAGVAAVAKGPDWPTMGSRYDRPASARPVSDAEASSETDVWRAMDKGEDPTV
jgi:uncharacterized membrane protein (TIGR02234 family)